MSTKKLHDFQFDRLVVAAAESLFPQFWTDLLRVVRQARVLPEMTKSRVLPVPPHLVESLNRLEALEWPFATMGDDNAGLLRAFRLLARRAEISGWKTLDFESLWGE